MTSAHTLNPDLEMAVAIAWNCGKSRSFPETCDRPIFTKKKKQNKNKRNESKIWVDICDNHRVISGVDDTMKNTMS